MMYGRTARGVRRVVRRSAYGGRRCKLERGRRERRPPVMDSVRERAFLETASRVAQRRRVPPSEGAHATDVAR